MKFLLFLFFLVPIIATAQNPTGLMLMPKKLSWSLFSCDVNAGYKWYRREVNRTNVNDLVKDGSDLHDSNGNFYSFQWPYFNVQRSHFFEANVGFRTSKMNRIVNFGVVYTQDTPRYGRSTIDYQVTTIDTLSLMNSSGGSTTVLLDSVWEDRESLWANQKVISLKGEYVFRTVKSRVTGYAGFGGQIGVSLMREIQHIRSQVSSSYYADTNGYSSFQNQYSFYGYGTYAFNETLIESEVKHIKAKTVVVVSPYLPVGVEFSPFMKRRRLSRVVLELKGMVGAEFHLIKGSRTNIRPFYSASTGIKYLF